jgi:phosphatidylserine decarboxylase
MRTVWKALPHQYIERNTGRILNERLIADRAIRLLYSRARESTPQLFHALTSARISSFLGFIHYDLELKSPRVRAFKFFESCGIDWRECVDDPQKFRTLRDVFERKIRYWECRPMTADPRAVTSPADARVLMGSFSDTSDLFLKDKFFAFDQLIGSWKQRWLEAFHHGDFAVFRLTPDKYHYNHTPVAGIVQDHYELPGSYHSCNPSAVLAESTPYSKNKRVVTVIDTDTAQGTRVGLVAMIEIVALMIGEVVQCYSEARYDDPKDVVPGMFLKKGCPKSLYRPGSSTDVLLFQRGRVTFDADLLRNQHRSGVESRFSMGFGRPLVETDVKVRCRIGTGIG